MANKKPFSVRGVGDEEKIKHEKPLHFLNISQNEKVSNAFTSSQWQMLVRLVKGRCES
jgi:hypothetical protein